MLPENFNMTEITEARRKAIQQTIRPIAADELKTVEDEMFPYHDDPWRERFSEFVNANAGSSFYHATTHDQIHIIYCHRRRKRASGISRAAAWVCCKEKGLKM